MKVFIFKVLRKIKQVLGKVWRKLTTKKRVILDKETEEIMFWEIEIGRYVKWFDGEVELYKQACPAEEQKVQAPTKELSAMLTWFNLHQKEKYYKDLCLEKDAFKGKKLLDVGSGPFPNALVFDEAEVTCLDPLLHKYIKAGFPLHTYGNRATFANAYSEKMPFADNSFDAVISVNAIDHVDDLQQTANEIRRVLKEDGLFRMHVHYHKPMPTEPIEITDELFLEVFKDIKGLNKIHKSSSKTGYDLKNADEKYVVWSNFE